MFVVLGFSLFFCVCRLGGKGDGVRYCFFYELDIFRFRLRVSVYDVGFLCAFFNE